MKFKVNSFIPENFISFAVVFCVILNEYNSGIPGVQLGELLIVVSCFLYVINKRAFYFDKQVIYILYFFLIGIITSFFSMSIAGSNYETVNLLKVISRIIRYGSYILCMLICIEGVNKKRLLKIYKSMCLIISLYMIIQFAMYYIFNIMLPVKLIPFFTWDRDSSIQFYLETAKAGFFRPSGVFPEPGYAVCFLLPGLALFLNNENDGKNPEVCKFICALIAITITLSLQGVLVGIITILLFVYRKIVNKNGGLKLHRYYFWLILIGLAFLLIFSQSDLFSYVVKRISRISNVLTEGGNGSTALRLFRGFSVFAQMPILYKFIGCGMGNIGNFVVDYQIVTKYDSYTDNMLSIEFVNGISAVLIMNGIIGFLLFFIWMVYLYRKVSGVYRIILIQFLILQFAGVGILSLDGVFYITIITLGLHKNYLYTSIGGVCNVN